MPPANDNTDAIITIIETPGYPPGQRFNAIMPDQRWIGFGEFGHALKFALGVRGDLPRPIATCLIEVQQ